MYRTKTSIRLLSATIAAVVADVLALWVMPWVPIGITQGDLSPTMWVVVALATGSAFMSSLAFITGAALSSERDLVEILQGLVGRSMRMCNRQQLFRRLAKGCERARRDKRSTLSFILVRVSSGDRDAVEHIAQALVAHVRSSDVVGHVADDELGVLAIGADAETRARISARLERALAAALVEWTQDADAPKAPRVSLGASTLRSGGDPDSVITVARQSLHPLETHTAQAA